MATIKLRRDTYQHWYDRNPVLASGEPGFDTTNNKLKIGNGTAAWQDLPYLTDETGSNSTDRLVSGDYTLLLTSNSDLTVPGTIKSAVGTSYIDIYDSNITVQSSPGITWQFDPSGIVRTSNTFTKTSISNITTTAPTVVWTATEDFISGVKLQIQVEANEVSDATGWHSQVCEAIVASRGYASTYGGPGGDPVMTVYGVTHTSTVPLVTFTVQRNPTTKKIEVVGTVTAATTAASLRIYSVETATRD